MDANDGVLGFHCAQYANTGAHRDVFVVINFSLQPGLGTLV